MKIKGFELYDTSGIPYLLRLVLFSAAISVVLVIYMFFFMPERELSYTALHNPDEGCSPSLVLDTVYTEENPLRIGISSYYPPLEFVNSSGTPTGLHIDLYKALMERAGISHYEFVPSTWTDNVQRFKEALIDVTISLFRLNHMSSDERVGRISDIEGCIMVRDDSDYYTMEDLTGSKLGIDSLLITHKYGETLPFEEQNYWFGTLEERINMFKAGHVQGIIVEKDVADYLIRHANFDLQNMRTIDVNFSLQFIMISQSTCPDLHHRLRTALRELYGDDTLAHIRQRWIVDEVVEAKRERSYMYAFFTLSFFVLVLPLGYMLVMLSRRHRMSMRNQQNLIMHSLKNMPLPVYIKQVNVHSEFLYANPATIDLIGDNGNKVSSFQQDPEVEKRHREIEEEIMRTGTPYFGTEHWVLLDGQELDMQVTKARINFTGSQAIIVVGMVINDMVEARNRSLQAERMKNAFIASMTKSIREPLDGIIAYSTALCQSQKEEEQEIALGKLNKANDNLLYLVNQAINESARIASYTEEGREWVDLCEVFQDHYERITENVERSIKLLDVQFSSPCKDVQAFVPRPFVEDFVATIIGVARELTGQGHLHVYWSTEPDRIHLYVECNATQLKDEQINELFVFDPEDVQDTMRGSLYYTYSVLKEAGGHLHVLNLAGEGLILHAVIPAQIGKSVMNEEYNYSSLQRLEYMLSVHH